MAAQTKSTHVPWWAAYFNHIARPLLAAGVPMGPDVLLTVRGRKSGLPHATPVTLCEYAGRRGLISPFGETDWARNLRAAGQATIRFRRKAEEVTAVELSGPEAAAFIREPPSATAVPADPGSASGSNCAMYLVSDSIIRIEGAKV